MTAITPVNMLGQQLATGDARKLHRDLYATEVQTKFLDKLVTEGKHMNKVLTGGKSYKFPIFGGASGLTVHTPGAAPTPSQVKRDELQVNLDERIVHTLFQDELDEALADIDARRLLVDAQAFALAKAKDSTIFRMMVKAARSPGLIAGEMPGGSTLKNAGFRTDAKALVSGLFDAATELQTKNVDLSTVSAFITPAQHSLLVQSKDVLNKDWGGEGSYAQNSIAMVAGIALTVTNNLPSENLSTDATIAAAGLDPALIFAKYRGDYSKLAAIVASDQAVATVTAVNLQTRFVPAEERFGEYVMTHYAYGAGVFRPECAIELATA